MALIAFPFIACLVLGPFLLLAVFAWLKICKASDEYRISLTDARAEARCYFSKVYIEESRKGHFMTDEEQAELEKEALEKFGADYI